MLVLTRRPGESIRINDNIRIEVLNHVGNTIRLGIQAPQEVPVHREEVWWRIHGGEYSIPGMNKMSDDTYSYVSAKGVNYTITQKNVDGNNFNNALPRKRGNI